MGRQRERTDHILIFEPDISGHQAHYVSLLLRHNVSRSRPVRVTVAGDPALAGLVAASACGPSSTDSGVFLALSSEELRHCRHPNLALRSLHLWRTARRQLAACGAGHLHFLHIDHLQLPLALRLRPHGDATVSGILFRPSRSEAASGLGSALRAGQKRTLFRAALANPALTALFSLDPEFCRAEPHPRLTYLPDPIPDVVFDRERGLRGALRASVPQGRIVFLLFGALSRRKGIFQTLEALRRLPASEQRRAAVVFAGRVDPQDAPRFADELARLKETAPALYVHLEDRFLDDQEVADLVAGCDVVLAPYQRFGGSSGILLWAAAAGRPVLAADYGLIGTWVRQHRLGLAVDAGDPTAIAAGMVALAGDRTPEFSAFDPVAAAGFAGEHRPERFAAAFFDTICTRETPWRLHGGS